ncbi:hypothetical protein ABT369_19570 [Dactylosporangium sp. NPDC000244]|uniref:hypothetical protein n=1 Tax=Dactylosporangium sp. NPDC000244 TaxID=3154365 RepID=UPI00331EE214
MPDQSSNTATADALAHLDKKSRQLLGALTVLGATTAGNLAVHVGFAYSTTTPKLRKLAAAGLVEPHTADSGQTVWRLTTDGHTLVAASTLAAPNAAAATDTDEQQPAIRHAADPDVPAERDAVPSVPAPHQPPDRHTCEAADAGRNGATGTEPSQEPLAAEPPPAAYTDASGELTTAVPTSGEPHPAAPAGSSSAEPAAGATGHGTVPAPSDPPNSAQPKRRGPGELDRAILAILAAHPEQTYKVGELSKLVDRADQGTGLPKASPGAVVLAAQRLVAHGKATLAVEQPASFQLHHDAAAAASADAATSI